MHLRKITKSLLTMLFIVIIVSVIIFNLKAYIQKDLNQTLWYTKIAFQESLRDIEAGEAPIWKPPLILSLVGQILPIVLISDSILLGLILFIGSLLGKREIKSRFTSALYQKEKVEDINGISIIPFGDGERGFVSIKDTPYRDHGLISFRNSFPYKFLYLRSIKKEIEFSSVTISIVLFAISLLILVVKDYFITKSTWGLNDYLFWNLFIDLPIILTVFFSGTLMGSHIIKRKLTCTWKGRNLPEKIGDIVIIQHKAIHQGITFAFPYHEIMFGFSNKKTAELFESF